MCLNKSTFWCLSPLNPHKVTSLHCTSQDSSAKVLDGYKTSAAAAVAMTRPSGSLPIHKRICFSLLRKRRSTCSAFLEGKRLSRSLSSSRRQGKRKRVRACVAGWPLEKWKDEKETSGWSLRGGLMIFPHVFLPFGTQRKKRRKKRLDTILLCRRTASSGNLTPRCEE